MPYLETAQEWLTQSALLLQARPTTTRINTKYTLRNPTKTLSAIKKSAARKTASSKEPKVDPSSATTGDAASLPTTKATLTLKTYDPASGTTLKYETDKAAEVGRLVGALSRLGRAMAGLPELKEDAVMMDAGADGAEGIVAVAPTPGSGVATPVQEGKPAAGGAGGKKGKKKGKK